MSIWSVSTRINQGIGFDCKDLGPSNMCFPGWEVPELVGKVEDVLPPPIDVEMLQGLHQFDVVLVQLLRLAASLHVKILEAEGVEGHVEKVGVVRRLGATATPQQPAMEQRLGALHARGAGQQRTGILRLRRINKEPRMAWLSANLCVHRWIQTQQLGSSVVQGEIHRPTFGAVRVPRHVLGAVPQLQRGRLAIVAVHVGQDVQQHRGHA
mmetsp:Transcript_9572/g.19966  ORF Transcript_9572/g.19966 Transcript_9572/m.19966 type:complete len:210 (-) Transcript_9572:77-706(-)